MVIVIGYAVLNIVFRLVSGYQIVASENIKTIISHTNWYKKKTLVVKTLEIIQQEINF